MIAIPQTRVPSLWENQDADKHEKVWRKEIKRKKEKKWINTLLLKRGTFKRWENRRFHSFYEDQHLKTFIASFLNFFLSPSLSLSSLKRKSSESAKIHKETKRNNNLPFRHSNKRSILVLRCYNVPVSAWFAVHDSEMIKNREGYFKEKVEKSSFCCNQLKESLITMRCTETNWVERLIFILWEYYYQDIVSTTKCKVKTLWLCQSAAAAILIRYKILQLGRQVVADNVSTIEPEQRKLTN